MENKNETFTYTYSSKQQEEIRNIRSKYLPKEEDKMEQLRRLDRSASKKGTVVSVTLGVIGCMLLGVGMCCTMVWDGLMVIGIIVGLVGIVGCVGAWLLYRQTVARETKRIAPSIEAAYDSLATACEEAQTVLGAA